jgi:multiple sugar transport system substrate-binding protein
MSKLEQTKTADVVPGQFYSDISGHELDRFLEFVDRFHAETDQSLGLTATPREVPVIVQLMRSHLRGRLETPSSLIAASGLARGTAHRMIESMIDDGMIARRPRSRSGKTFSLHPSPKLIRNWLDYVRRTKSLLGTAFGLAEGADYFFGASYLSAGTIPPLPVMQDKLQLPGKLRVLIHADPTFMAMQKLKRQFEMHFGVDIDVRALSLDRLHREVLENRKLSQSRYDIVTCDLCWMPELIASEVVQPFEELDSPDAREFFDFHPEALATAQRGQTLYGVPVQTTPELLIYRTDLLARKDIKPPETLGDMMAAARALHDPWRSRHASGHDIHDADGRFRPASAEPSENRQRLQRPQPRPRKPDPYARKRTCAGGRGVSDRTSGLFSAQRAADVVVRACKVLCRRQGCDGLLLYPDPTDDRKPTGVRRAGKDRLSAAPVGRRRAANSTSGGLEPVHPVEP